MPDWVRLYQRTPYPGRVLAATLRGAYLSCWRYGLNHEQLIVQAAEHETWSRPQIEAWQQENLAILLHRAATQVPYYRQQWEHRRRVGDRASWDYLDNWPILDKETVRQNSRAFVADNCNPSHMFHEHTSGTSGKSLDLWWSRQTVQAWYALFERRCRRWYGVARHDRWAIFGGQLVTSVGQVRPPFWVWNAALHQLYMSSYHLAPSFIPHYLDALKEYRVTYLWGYSSSLYALAQEALRLGRRDIKVSVAITNAEPLYDYQRTTISEAFQCPVRETYGMAEIVAAASECEYGAMHLWPEVGLLQYMPGQMAGELVATGLLNTDMPLIRYRLGDRASLPVDVVQCPCGRTLPIINSVDGRADDVLYTADGRIVGRLDPVFKTHLPVREAQIIQETLTSIRVKFVPALDYSEQASQSIIARIRDRLGPVDVILDPVAEIARTSNGKFRAVICNLSAQQKADLQSASISG